MKFTILFCLGMAIGLALPARGSQTDQTAPYSNQADRHVVSEEAIAGQAGLEQLIGSQVPLAAAFYDERGETVKLGRYFNGKPVILALVYYGCPNLCTLVLNGILQTAQELKFDVGNEYQIVVVSFDERERPPLAVKKKSVYLHQYWRPNAADGWHFLTGDRASIEALAKSVGFHFSWDKATQQFAHPSTMMVLTPEGRVSRYFPGIEYPPREVRLALIDASGNQLGSLSERIYLLCYHYNPNTGKYGLVIWRTMQIGGCGTVLLLAAYLVRLSRNEPKA